MGGWPGGGRVPARAGRRPRPLPRRRRTAASGRARERAAGNPARRRCRASRRSSAASRPSRPTGARDRPSRGRPPAWSLYLDVHGRRSGAAPARVAGCGERAVGPPLDGGDAAEEEVAARPAVTSQPLEGRRTWSPRPRGGGARRPRGGAARRSPPPRHAATMLADLHDRGGQPDGAGAAESRRGSPPSRTSVGVIMLGSRSPGAWAVADHVELAQHVVELGAPAENPEPGAERRGQPGRRRPRRRPTCASSPSAAPAAASPYADSRAARRRACRCVEPLERGATIPPPSDGGGVGQQRRARGRRPDARAPRPGKRRGRRPARAGAADGVGARSRRPRASATSAVVTAGRPVDPPPALFRSRIGVRIR